MDPKVITIHNLIDETTLEATLQYPTDNTASTTCRDTYRWSYLKTLHGTVDALEAFQGKQMKDEEDEEDVTGLRRVLSYLTSCFGRPAKGSNPRGDVSPVARRYASTGTLLICDIHHARIASDLES